MMFSAYDYVVNASLGFHVDFDKSLGQKFEEELKAKKITAEKLDSLIEKTENPISDLHRPIVASGSAERAQITAHFEQGPSKKVRPLMSSLTFDYLATTVKLDDGTSIEGAVSSFNINT